MTSSYAPGLMLLFLGMPVLLPMTAREASVLATVLFVCFASLPLWTGEQFGSEAIAILFFNGAAVVECIVSTSVLDSLRFTDFKQRRELERARDELAELDRTKSRFTANVHHELRTPLTLMLAPIEAMRLGDFGALTGPVEKATQTMHVNGLRLLKLINNLLDLSKVESGEARVQRREMRVEQLLAEVVDGARPMAERKSIRLEALVADSPPVVYADTDSIEKVLVNLVGNSLKFTPEGGEIRLEAESDGDGVHVRVVDSGVGIPPDQIGRIFDRFAQVDTSATRDHEGTGIGLSLVQELVHLHGGRVWAESAGVGQGATFHFTLPAGEPDALEEELVVQSDGRELTLGRSFEALRSEIEQSMMAEGTFDDIERNVRRWEDRSQHGGAAGEAGALDQPEVLVVEDNPDMRELLAFVVGREFRVRTARNGREGLQAARAEAPDLILTDVMMPEMSGTELCRAIKHDSQLRGVPVVLVTSKAEREMKIEGLELGADDYVSKPFHPRELLARVRSLVKLRRLQIEAVERNRELEQAMAELKQAEVQLIQAERLGAVGELAAGVAHEVNNPVNFALNAVRTLRSSVAEVREVAQCVAELELENPQKREAQLAALGRLQGEVGLGELGATLDELAGIVTEGLERTHRLVGELRDFAAPGRGARVGVDLQRGIQSTLHLLQHTLTDAQVRVVDEMPPALPLVQGDPGALNQVFLNILKNAAEAMAERGGVITLQSSAEGGWVEIGVVDDGPGMDAETRKRLFEPFFTTKEAGKGTGLGLAISRRIVDEHGGRLDVHSKLGEGTRVSVRLPLELAAGDADAA
ncbi:MAG: ATP-binding protein [Proteobacteria bacterium]|nr:ATP-binding protein [Pseudomonadota bacterium]